MKILGKEYGYRRWNWGVEWTGNGKREIKNFLHEADARAFFDKRRRNLCTPTLFRFKAESTLSRVMQATLIIPLPWRRPIQLRILPLVLITYFIVHITYIWSH